MATIREALEQAVAHHQAGRLNKAARLYRIILEVRPRHADALHLSGVVAHQRGDAAKAIELIERAIAVNPKSASYHRNLGSAWVAAGEHAKAVTCQHEALRLSPDFAEAHHSLGEALRGLADHEAAIAAYREAIRLKPDYLHAHNGLGVALAELGRNDDARAAYARAIEIDPDFAEAHVNLANLLRTEGRHDDAIAHFRKALEIKPRSIAALVNLGNVYKDRGRVSEAAALYQQALEVLPTFAGAHNNLANCFKDQGRIDAALVHCERALEYDPSLVDAHSNLLLTLHYAPGHDPDAIFAAHRAWAARYAAPLAAGIGRHQNDPAPERRLRIGYVSPDLKRHPVAVFIGPVLAQHDRTGFEVFCYANNEKSDHVTAGLKQLKIAWRDLRGMPDEAAAALVRRDRIDVLVDLAGHTARNRLRLLAHKPAPVQVSFLGYPDTTGLETVDYRITDRWADPPGETEAWHTETLIRLEGGFNCYRPPAHAPPVGPSPASVRGRVRFASFNMLAKVGPTLIESWARILAAVPNSEIVLKAPALADEGACARIHDLFAEQGIAPGRVALHAYMPSAQAHLALYNTVDIGLDTFPYNGATTTCEALWMGVPVITLAGRTHVGRVGVSLLSRLGLEALIASSAEAYVVCAVELARDGERLAALRAGLRARMERSELTDIARFTRALEAAYRDMWRRWYASRADD